MKTNAVIDMKKKDFFTGRKVLVMGLGRFGGGVDVVRFATSAGAKVTVTDLAPQEKLTDSIDQLKGFSGIEFHLGSHRTSDFEQADIIIANPAVAPDNEILKLAAEQNKIITSQVNIFFQLCPALIIGITGANGKSTTAALAAHLLKAAIGKDYFKYTKVWLSGNIGNEPLLAVIDQISSDDLVVLELSSFQTENLVQINKAPEVALLTNLTPNHLDRHGTFENYCAAKENIFRLQKTDTNHPAVSIFNSEDAIGRQWYEKYRKDNGRICIGFSTDDVSEQIREVFSLPGRANLSNLAAAIAVARHFGVDDESIKDCLPAFKPLPHRLELVAEINGVKWYNDSIATTPQSAIAALEAFTQPRIIIAGGYNKNIPFDELGERIAHSTKAAILIGQTAQKIADSIEAHQNSQSKIIFADSLTKAVESARDTAVSGDIVLLSPACASYDMFDNFQHRGQEFAKLVHELIA